MDIVPGTIQRSNTLSSFFCKHLLWTDFVRELLGDVTLDEYNDFFKKEATLFEKMLQRCSLKLTGTEYVTFLNVVRSYHVYAMSLLSIGTFKKLRPEASQAEKENIHFSAWVATWIGCAGLVINDVCDGRISRASQPTISVTLGSDNAMCFYITTNNVLCDMVTETFASEPFLFSFLSICRHHVNTILLSMLIDTSCEKYDKRWNAEWYKSREYSSCTSPTFVLPVELAFCVAQASISSKAGQASLELGKLLGSALRTMDDAFDFESDLKAKRMNCLVLAAWNSATDEQKDILVKCCSSLKSSEDVPPDLKVLYRDMNIQKKCAKFTIDKIICFTKNCERYSSEVPKNTWMDNLHFYKLLYSGKGRFSFQDQE